MVNGSGTKFSIKHFSTQILEIYNCVWPQMEDIIPRKSISLLHNCALETEQCAFNTEPQTHRTAAYDQHIQVLVGLIEALILLQLSALIIRLPQTVRLPIIGLGLYNLINQTCIRQLLLLFIMQLLQMIIVKARMIADIVCLVGGIRRRVPSII